MEEISFKDFEKKLEESEEPFKIYIPEEFDYMVNLTWYAQASYVLVFTKEEECIKCSFTEKNNQKTTFDVKIKLSEIKKHSIYVERDLPKKVLDKLNEITYNNNIK